MKNYYNCRHAPRFFKVEDMVNLHLHRSYTLPGFTNHKTGQQFVRPLKVLEQIRRLAYRLEIPVACKIHPVILVGHLEVATQPSANPYQRPRMDHPRPMKPEEDIKNTKDHYIIKKLFGKQVTQEWT